MTSESILPTSIEQLSIETFLQFFCYFDLRELITTFFGLNSHINSIIQSVRNASHIVRYNDPGAIKLLQLFPKQIARLIIVKTDMVDFTSLSNLRSLTLKYVSETQLKSIHSQYFPLLEILHIYVCQLQKNLVYQEITLYVCFSDPQTLLPKDTIEVDDLFQMILSNKFPRLWLCTVLGVEPLIENTKWTLSPSIRFLYVEMKAVQDYERLFHTCPNLRWFPTSKNVSIDPVLRKTFFIFSSFCFSTLKN